VSGADVSNAINALSASLASNQSVEQKSLQDALAKITAGQTSLAGTVASGFQAEHANTQASIQTLVKSMTDQNAALSHENNQAIQSAMASMGQNFGSPIASLGAALSALQQTLAGQSAAMDRLGQEVATASHQTQVIYQPAQGAPAANQGSSGGGNNASAIHSTGGSVVSYAGHTYDLGTDAGRTQMNQDGAHNVIPSGPGGTYIQRILDAHPPA
jgi:hypothetical protein